MVNRKFRELVLGPMTPDAPSVDDLRRMRHEEIHGEGVDADRFVHGDDREVVVATVTQGQPEAGDGTMTDEEMARFRRTATAKARREMPDEKSFSERRHPETGHTIRTYEDGRIVDMDADETQPRRGQLVHTPRVWYVDGDTE
ncbi:hypothetical protein [Streptomyces phaeochromogenes]|uniref:hypothetical protein n=1 Tax=Streptomyces phaeochromogenes TaxID=1923 RepID=UPI003688140C